MIASTIFFSCPIFSSTRMHKQGPGLPDAEHIDKGPQKIPYRYDSPEPALVVDHRKGAHPFLLNQQQGVGNGVGKGDRHHVRWS